MSRLARCSRWAVWKCQSHIQTPSFSTSSFASTPTRALHSPPPIYVELTPYAGRGVFASRRIGAGELIHTAKPIVSHPSLSSLHSVCYFCLRKLPNRETSSGAQQTVSFCSKQCEEQIEGLKYPLLVKRLALQVISEYVSPDILQILQPAKLSVDKICQMKKELSLLRRAIEDSGIKCEQMEFLTEEWYTGVLARIHINAFRIDLAVGSYEDLLSSAAAAEAAVGNAVYLFPSLYNHDCDPNLNILWTENVDAKIKALRDIEEGEELRICYIDASMGYDARQRILYEGFGFQCKCHRCVYKY